MPHVRLSFNPSHMIGLHKDREKLLPGWDLRFRNYATGFVLMDRFFCLQLSKDQRRVLTDSYCASTAKKAIEQRLLGFLNYNSYHLPMYAKPGMP